MALEPILLNGAVFDFDGVIGDTEGQKYQAWRETLTAYRIELSVDEYVRNFAGKSGEVNIAYINRTRELNLTTEVVDAKNARLRELIAREVILMPYAREAVEFFRQKRLPLAVASSDGQEETEHKIKLAGLEGMFNIAIGTDKKKRDLQKPHPFIYRRAVELLGLASEVCLAFEDTSSGVISAKDAGLVCIAVPNKWSQSQDFSRADKVVNSLEQAIRYVRETYKL